MDDNSVKMNGYLFKFDEPTKNGIIFTRESFNPTQLDELKINGIIKDYEIDEYGIKITEDIDLHSVSL